jgi:hypothetical protein
MLKRSKGKYNGQSVLIMMTVPLNMLKDQALEKKKLKKATWQPCGNIWLFHAFLTGPNQVNAPRGSACLKT